MNKTKKFWNDHKTEICIVGGTIVIGAIAYAITKQNFWLIPKNEKVIHWKGEGKSFDLESIKLILDANKDSSTQFAIFREGPDPSKYAVIVTKDIESFVKP